MGTGLWALGTGQKEMDAVNGVSFTRLRVLASVHSPVPRALHGVQR